jgi:hypothetical protein
MTFTMLDHLQEDKTEIIRCGQCKSIFAACLHGWQDQTWAENRKKYQKAGCKVEIVATSDFRNGKLAFAFCECPKQARERGGPEQLNLF